MARATRESVAYKDEIAPALGRFDTRRSSLRPVASAPVEIKSGSGRKIRRARRLVTPLRAIGVALIALLGVALIYSHMQLTELTSEISEREATLSELQSTNVSLSAKREELYSADYIAEYAQDVLGMVKVDASQMEYVELSNPEKIEVTGAGASVSGAVGTLVRGFTAVLEYLR